MLTLKIRVSAFFAASVNYKTEKMQYISTYLLLNKSKTFNPVLKFKVKEANVFTRNFFKDIQKVPFKFVNKPLLKMLQKLIQFEINIRNNESSC